MAWKMTQNASLVFRRLRVRLVSALCFLLLQAAYSAPLAEAKSPPPTRKDNVKETLHGVELVDPYRWLEDQQAAETRAWIDVQNVYTHSVLDSLPARARLEKRLAELMKVDVIGTPWVRNGRYFFTKRLAEADLPVIYFRQGRGGEDQVLIDPHGMSADRTVSVTILDVSDDGKRLAYGIRQGGADEIALRLFDVDQRRDLEDRLPTGRYFTVSLKKDNSGFFYSSYGPEGPRVFYHPLGGHPGDDTEIFGSRYGPGVIIAAGLSHDGQKLLVTVMHGSAARKTEIYVKEVSTDGPVSAIVNDIEARFEGEIGGGQLFLHTNWKAPNGRVLAIDLENPARENWREVVAESEAIIDSFTLAGGRLVVNDLNQVRSRVRIFEPDGRLAREIEFDQIGSISPLSGRWESDEAFFTFTSFHIPPSIYRYEVESGRRSEWSRLDVPIEPERFEVRQVHYESKDGTRIPMFLLHTKGLELDGRNPTFLTGYGGFNLSRTPSFSAKAIAWVEQGGVFALPNLRGGGEFGEAWHEAGMLEKKQNVFDDFISAAQWLIAEGYTRPEKLSIRGGSNGGLLVGAFMTQRPKLCRAVVCTYPLLDMVRYHKFLVARFWVPEYGSSEDPEQFEYIRAYSPYHNVKPGTEYPAVLFVTGDSDTRVDPLHARKMTALLQSATGSERPVLLRYDTKAGHSRGSTPVTKQIDETTDELSFLLWQLGADAAAAGE